MTEHDCPTNAEWAPFNQELYAAQPLPPLRKDVLVFLTPREHGRSHGIAVGYLKFGAGDKDSPYFVVPGLWTGAVLAWKDCLPPEFSWEYAKRAGGCP